MDFWNKQKVRELKGALREKDTEIETLRNLLKLAEKKIKGERVCDGYCTSCVHAVNRSVPYSGGGYTEHICELDCKCKDFRRIGAKQP